MVQELALVLHVLGMNASSCVGEGARHGKAAVWRGPGVELNGLLEAAGPPPGVSLAGLEFRLLTLAWTWTWGVTTKAAAANVACNHILVMFLLAIG